MPEKVGDWYIYTGAIHIHTTESDGTKSLDEVVAIGQSAGLEFLMFSDHMNLNNLNNGKEGFYGKTLAVVGYEHNDPQDNHHYLLFGSPRVYPAEMTAAQYVAAGAADGALGILAHPDEIRDSLDEYPAYPWKDWNVDGFVGIELWNQMSEWMEKLSRWNKLLMSLSPRKSMVAPTDRILKKWDELNMTRKVAGIAGVDAHAFPVRAGLLKVEIFPYKVHFRCLRLHILMPEPMSGDFPTAKQQLYDAIKDCRLYFSNMRWGATNGFEFYARSGAEKVVSGGRLSSTDNALIVASVPSSAELKLVHNGQVVVRTTTRRLEYRDVKPGIYRIEAWKGQRGWVFSNHIRVAV